jgi:serine protease Do
MILGSVATAQDDAAGAWIRLYRKTAPSVVGITVPGTGRSGTGFIADARGYVVTSSTVPQSIDRVQIHLKGHRRVFGRVVGRSEKRELAVIRIPADQIQPLELGDSDAVRLGQIAAVIGDSFNSIITDGQPALSAGVLSGRYAIDEDHRRYYTGPVLETSAAVNPNQGGSPLVDAAGRVIGMVTLNYDEAKFTGLAIPINLIKDDFTRIVQSDTAVIADAPPPDNGAWLGAEIEDSPQGLVVTRVARRGPADRAGVRLGDLVKSVDGKAADTARRFHELLSGLAPGASVELRVTREGGDAVLLVTLAKRRSY